MEDGRARSRHVPRRRLPEGSGVLRGADGMEAAERRWHAGGDGPRRMGHRDLPQAPAGSFETSASAAGEARGRGGQGAPVRAVVESFCFVIEPWNAKTVEAE